MSEINVNLQVSSCQTNRVTASILINYIVAEVNLDHLRCLILGSLKVQIILVSWGCPCPGVYQARSRMQYCHCKPHFKLNHTCPSCWKTQFRRWYFKLYVIVYSGTFIPFHAFGYLFYIMATPRAIFMNPWYFASCLPYRWRTLLFSHRAPHDSLWSVLLGFFSTHVVGDASHPQRDPRRSP